MYKKELRGLYLKSLKESPDVRKLIHDARMRPDRTLAMPFGAFDDNPFLLYATCGLAGMEGVTVVLRPGS